MRITTVSFKRIRRYFYLDHVSREWRAIHTVECVSGTCYLKIANEETVMQRRLFYFGGNLNDKTYYIKAVKADSNLSRRDPIKLMRSFSTQLDIVTIESS